MDKGWQNLKTAVAPHPNGNLNLNKVIATALIGMLDFDVTHEWQGFA